MANEYVPLHVHTTFSPDGLGTVDALVEFAAKNFRAMAVTDHGTLGGIAEFWRLAKDAGLRPIFGNEIYMNYAGKRGHLTVLASGQDGFNSLVSLNNEAHRNLDNRSFPIVTMEMLAQYNSGLTVLSGCSASPLYAGDEAQATLFMGELYDIFGPNRLFAELMGVYHEDNVSRPMVMAKRFGLKPVVTTDSHFVRPEFSGAHKIMTQCRKGYDYSSNDLYLKTPNELLNNPWFKGILDSAFIQELMQNTIDVAEGLDSFDLSSPPALPKADVIEIDGKQVNIFNVAEMQLHLYTYVISKEKGSVANKRFKMEVETIKDLGLVDYFSILYDIVEFCHREGIKIGPGRGSGGGSFFLYLLGITEVDPIENGLLFERFLSKSRRDMADFDLDVDAEQRDRVLEYAKQRWGALPIANYATYSNASLIRDLGRIYKVPMSITEQAAELGDSDHEILESFFDACQDTPTGSGFVVTNNDARTAYDTMLSQVRHRGKHAGGVVIVTRPVPVEGGLVAWTEGVKSRVLSQVGLVKYDILGVTALAQLQEMEDLTRVHPGNPGDKDSDKVFQLFEKGETTGIFQFSGSQGIVELTKEVKPKTLGDLGAINALYRPGPLDSGMAWTYPEAKNNPRKIDPKVDEILKDTYGVIVYQEQVMALVALITGGSLEDADDARKLISKGKPNDPVWQAKMRKLEQHFKSKGAAKKFPQKVVDTLWSEIVTFGRYGFNKSHSIAYSLLAYRMAWFKTYYPGAFYTALLNSDQENAIKWVYDAALHGVNIVPPHINLSEIRWRWDKSENVIYAPLSVVKYFGEKGAKGVIELRQAAGGEFKTFAELKKIPKGVLNKRAIKLLYYSTAFRGLVGSVSEILEDYANLPFLSESDSQIESFGFVLPSERIIEFLKGEYAAGRVAGFVKEIEERDKGKGKYKVFRLAPHGQFWSKKESVLNIVKEGDCVSAELTNYGCGERVKRLRL